MIISVINLKGGSLKTTTAIMLAEAASRDGFSVSVLDADPQSSASQWGEAIDSFEVLPTNATFIKKLTAKGSEGGVFVIDCPPNGKVVDEAMLAADLVLIPTMPDPANLAKTIETAETVRDNGVPYAVLIAAAVPKTRVLAQARTLLETADIPVIEAVIPHRTAIKELFEHPVGKELYGYEKVWGEIKEAFA